MNAYILQIHNLQHRYTHVLLLLHTCTNTCAHTNTINTQSGFQPEWPWSRLTMVLEEQTSFRNSLREPRYIFVIPHGQVVVYTKQEFGDPFFLNPNNSTQKRGVGFEANQTNKILFASLVYKIHQVIALRGKTRSKWQLGKLLCCNPLQALPQNVAWG